jgi:hypothetical protein
MFLQVETASLTIVKTAALLPIVQKLEPTRRGRLVKHFNQDDKLQ